VRQASLGARKVETSYNTSTNSVEEIATQQASSSEEVKKKPPYDGQELDGLSQFQMRFDLLYLLGQFDDLPLGPNQRRHALN